MRPLALFVLPLVVSCASGTGPASCPGPDLARAEILAAVREGLRARGDDPGVVDNPKTTVEVVEKECEYLVRLVLPTPVVGNWIVFAVSRERQITDVYPGH